MLLYRLLLVSTEFEKNKKKKRPRLSNLSKIYDVFFCIVQGIYKSMSKALKEKPKRSRSKLPPPTATRGAGAEAEVNNVAPAQSECVTGNSSHFVLPKLGAKDNFIFPTTTLACVTDTLYETFRKFTNRLKSSMQIRSMFYKELMLHCSIIVIFFFDHSH